MNKITKEYLEDYVADMGIFEKEHRKYSSFYCSATYTITQTDIEELKTEGIDASDFLNVYITLNGTWDDSNGTEWDSMYFCKVEEYQELIPEQVIPAHYVTNWKTEVFVPVWE